MDTLIRKGFVQLRRAGDREHHHLLDTLRDHARECCAAAGETPPVSARHHAYFLRLAEHSRAGLTGAGQAAAMQALADAEPDIDAALDFAEQQLGVGAALALALACAQHWQLASQYERGLRILDGLLARHAAAPPRAAAQACIWICDMATRLGRVEQAERAAKRAIDHYEGVDAPLDQARLWLAYGMLKLVCFDYPAGREICLRAAECCRQGGDDALLAVAHNRLAEIGRLQGNWDEAAHYNELCLTQARHSGNPRMIGITEQNLGLVEVARGAIARGCDLLVSSARQFLIVGERHTWVYAFMGLGQACHLGGDPERSARFYAMVLSYGEETGLAPLGDDLLAWQRQVASLRQAMAAALFDAAWQEGLHTSAEAARQAVLDFRWDGPAAVQNAP
jgi:tetratricopeptide (TPR) repeat protein